MSFIGVSDSRDAAGFLLKRLAATVLRQEVADHEVKEAAVVGEFRGLDDCPRSQTHQRTSDRRRIAWVRTSGRARRCRMMSRADVADFMLRQLTDAAFIRKAVRILH